jgi:hypothetical protein
MTLSATPTPADVVAELRDTFPYTFPDGPSRWLAGVGSTDAITFPTSFASKQAVVVEAASGSHSDGTAGSTWVHTFSGLNFGADFTGRRIVVCIGGASLITSGATGSMTIGGVTATGEQHGAWDSNKGAMAGIFCAAPSGTSGNVVFFSNFRWTSLVAVVLSVAGLPSNTAYDTGAANNGGAPNSGVSSSLNIPANGVLISCGAHAFDTAGITLGGVTNKTDYSLSGGAFRYGFDNRLSTQTNKAVSASWGGSKPGAVVAKSFG